MSETLHGIAVSGGIAIGRAELVRSLRRDVPHYLIDAAAVDAEVQRLRDARSAVAQRLQHMRDAAPHDLPADVAAVFDVHIMLLQDEVSAQGVEAWVRERRYNAEWALASHLEEVVRQFDEIPDDYLRERKADMEQVAEHMLRWLQGQSRRSRRAQAAAAPGEGAAPLALVARDLSPADTLQFRRGLFAGFVTDAGGKTSHTAIVARSLGIPAVVGTRRASEVVHAGEWLIIDGDAGLVIANPTPAELSDYRFRQRQHQIERERLARLKNTPAITRDGRHITLLANIERPADTAAAVDVGAVGVGLLRSEFLFMNRQGKLPGEEEQYAAYRRAVEGMQGMPVTIRTADIGADKPLEAAHPAAASAAALRRLNPALGLRAIRWSLSEPDIFLTQVRAILRAAAHGAVNLLLPMLTHVSEICQALALIARAHEQLDARGIARGPVRIGAMIEVPAAALMVRQFAQHVDFLSIGTNDLVQYTLAVDRTDEDVAHLFDPLHPAVLRLIAGVIAEGVAQGKPVSLCGEIAGDAAMTRLLLGLGLRHFSMHPSRLLAVKQEVLDADTTQLSEWAKEVLASDEPAALLAAG